MASKNKNITKICLLAIVMYLTAGTSLPLTWAGEWRMVGPGGGGGLQCITAARDVEGKSTVYVGGDVSGVWRRKEDGRWEPINNGMAADMVNDIVISPNNPSMVFAGSNRGIFRSCNSGDRWNLLPFSLNRVTSALSISSHTIYAATTLSDLKESAINSQLHVSYDNGDNWITLKNFDSLWVPSIIPINDKTILIGTFSGVIRNTKKSNLKRDGGVFLSQDGGKSWKEVNSNLPAKQVFDLEIDEEGIIYSILPSPYGVWQSMDRGESWTPMNKGLVSREDYYQLYVNPHDGKTLYLTAGRAGARKKATGIWRFDKKRNRWERLTKIGENDDNVQKPWNHLRVNADANEMVIDPVNPERIFYVGRTIHRSDDDGKTWIGDAFEEKDGWWRNTGHCEDGANFFKRHPKKKNLFFLGHGDWRLSRSIDGGISWQMTASDLPWGISSGRDIIFDIENNEIYAAVGRSKGGKVIKSYDDGITWADANRGLPNAFIRRIAIDLNTPVDKRVLYAICIAEGVYRSTDGAKSWHRLENCPSPFSKGKKMLDYTDIDLHPKDNGVVYVCMTASNGKEGGIYVGKDYGENWKKLNNKQPLHGLVDLAIKPDEPKIMVATSKDGLYRSNDGGINWVKVYDLVVNMSKINSAVAFDPSHTNIVYAGASSYAKSDAPFQNWFLRSTNSGETWNEIDSPIGGKMPRITFIEVEPTGEIFVGTIGFGAYLYTP